MRHAEFIHDRGQWFDLEQEVDLKRLVDIKETNTCLLVIMVNEYMIVGKIVISEL